MMMKTIAQPPVAASGNQLSQGIQGGCEPGWTSVEDGSLCIKYSCAPKSFDAARNECAKEAQNLQ